MRRTPIDTDSDEPTGRPLFSWLSEGSGSPTADHFAPRLFATEVVPMVSIPALGDLSFRGPVLTDLFTSTPFPSAAIGVDSFAGFAWHTPMHQPAQQAAQAPALAPLAAGPLITVSDAVVDESNGHLTFTVTLSAVSAQSVSVSYNNSNITAANGSDYVAQTGTLTFAPGQTSLTVQVPVTDNGTAENTEYLALNLYNAVNGTIVQPTAWGTIVDDDDPPGTPTVHIGDRVVDETAGTVTFNITLDKPSVGAVSVDYATANGTAIAGSDYVAEALQTLNFAAGEVSKTVTVDLINDSSAEGAQYFDLVLSNVVGGTLAPEAHGRATIGANDSAPVGAPMITVSDAVVGEADGYLEFVVSLSAPSTQTVTVGFNNSNVTAAHGSDYLAQTNTLTFTPGQTTQTVRIPVLDNGTQESTEFLSLNLFSAVNATIGRQYGWGNIVDNDAVPGTPVVRVSDRVVDEAAGTVTFNVTLDKPSTGTVNVDYATANGSATAGSDYVATGTHTLTFVAGEVSKTVTVDLINDSSAEGREYFDLVLSNVVGGTLLPEAHGRATIGANDSAPVGAPQITVSDAVAGESDGMLQFVVSLNAPSTQTVTVNYNNSNQTAAHGSDYLAVSGTLTFAPGQTTQTVLLSVLDNVTQENTEFLTLNLYSAVNGTIVRQSGWGSIVDNDSTTGTPVLRVSDQVVDEADGTVTFTIALDKPSTETVSVNFATASGSATAGSDFVAQPTHTLSFLAGEVSKTITVDLVNDGSNEPGEYFDLVLSSPVGATLPDTNARVFIGPNDAPTVGSPMITVSDAVAGESDGTMQFVVSLSAPSTQTITVNYNNSNQTAAHGSDYLAQSGTLTFVPGQTTQIVTIPVLSNSTLENTEFLTLNLYSAVNGTIARQAGWGSIVDNDAVTGTPAVSVSDGIVDEAAARVTFTVTLDKPSTSQVTVNVATADGTASAGSDYESQASQKLVFGPGEMSKTVVIDLRSDASSEATEYFDLVLSGAVNATIADARGHVFIPQNDGATIGLPTIAAAAISAGEAGGYVEFVVSLDAPSTQTISVSYNNSNGTAAHGSDYLAQSGTLVFAPGETTQVLRMPVLDDVATESTETFSLNLFSPVNAQVGTSQVVVSIIDNDNPPPPNQVVDLGTANGDILIGRAGGNEDEGGQGNDALDGVDGVVMRGGAGNDLYIVESSTDSVTELAGEGTDKVASYISYTLGANVENLILRGTAANGTGNSLANVITGDNVNNTLNGMAGNDTMAGGLGNDTYIVANGGDVVIEAASEGTDLVKSSVSHTLSTNVENLTLTGTGAANGTGNTLANVITGNVANNTLNGGAGADTMAGGLGIDTYLIDNAGDVVNEAADEGDDLVQTSVTWALGDNVEHLTLTGSAEIDGTGNELANLLTGNAANNQLEGEEGNDTMVGGLGSDTMIGGLGDDTYVVANSTDVVTEVAAEGTDLVQSAISHTLAANVENLTLTGTGAASGTGNTLANVITGNVANNTLNGGTGADTMAGGFGNDTYSVDNAGDVTTEGVDEGTDLVQSSVTRTLSANIENLSLTGTANINGTGNTLANVITGNSGDNALSGGAGADTITGGAGADSLNGYTGADVFVFSSLTGSDTVADFSSGGDVFRISQAGIHIGDGDSVVDNGTVRAAPGGFSTAAELVIFTANIAGAITTASAAAQIGSATSAYSTGADVLFVVDNGTQSGIFRFHSSGADALVTADELTMVALVNGDLTALTDYTFGP